MYTASNYNDCKFSLDKITEVVDRLKAVERQEKTIFYSSEMHKSALEQYFNVQIDSDDYIVDTIIGKVRLVRAKDIDTKNQIFVIDWIWER